MRKRWVYVNGEAVPIEDYQAPIAGPFVWDDLKAYKSMATGEMVEGRAAHKEHLKRNRLVEVGDAYDKGVPQPKPLNSPPGLRKAIAEAVYSKLRYK